MKKDHTKYLSLFFVVMTLFLSAESSLLFSSTKDPSDDADSSIAQSDQRSPSSLTKRTPSRERTPFSYDIASAILHAFQTNISLTIDRTYLATQFPNVDASEQRKIRGPPITA